MPVIGRDSAPGVSLDDLFRTLSHSTRRWILVELIEESPLNVDECDLGRPQMGTEDPETAAIELYHRHLPVLDEAGFIDWEQETGQVKLGENFEEIRPLLNLMENHKAELPDDWP